MDRRLDRETVVESYYITYYKKKNKWTNEQTKWIWNKIMTAAATE